MVTMMIMMMMMMTMTMTIVMMLMMMMMMMRRRRRRMSSHHYLLLYFYYSSLPYYSWPFFFVQGQAEGGLRRRAFGPPGPEFSDLPNHLTGNFHGEKWWNILDDLGQDSIGFHLHSQDMDLSLMRLKPLAKHAVFAGFSMRFLAANRLLFELNRLGGPQHWTCQTQRR